MSFSFQVFTHHTAASSECGWVGQQLLATSGRYIAVASASGAIDLYDAENVTELQEVLGSGSCRFKLIGSLHVHESKVQVTVCSITFLNGGTLAVLGKSDDGIIVHVYQLTLSATAKAKYGKQCDPSCIPAQPAPTYEFKSAIGRDTAPDIELDVLPQLVYRAAIPHIKQAILKNVPSRPHTFAIVLENDTSVRMYDASPPADTVSVGFDACVGVISWHNSVSMVSISENGRLLAVASLTGEIAVFALDNCIGKVSGQRIATLLSDDPITSLIFVSLPTPPDAHLYSRFQYNDIALVSGHSNGFLCVWWLGNRDCPKVEDWVCPTPLISYPPFHASRGAITHLTTAVAQAQHPTPDATTLLCVGAQGAQGWRVYHLDHTEPTAPAGPWYAGETKYVPTETPNHVPGHYEWDKRGRRTFVPPAPRDVSHLLHACVRCPTYAECLRAPIIGDSAWSTHIAASLPIPSAHMPARGGEDYDRSSVSSLDSETIFQKAIHHSEHFTPVPRLTSGVTPLGCAIIPLHTDGAKGATRPLVSSNSVFRLLARSGHGLANFRHPATLSNETTGGLPRAALASTPRIVFALLTERGIHVAGFDYVDSVVGSVHPSERAAVALLTTKVQEKCAPEAVLPPPPVPAITSRLPHDVQTGVKVSEAPKLESRVRTAKCEQIASSHAKPLDAKRYWPSRSFLTPVESCRRTIFSATAPPTVPSRKPRAVDADSDAAALPPSLRYLPKHTRERELKKRQALEAGGGLNATIDLGKVIRFNGKLVNTTTTLTSLQSTITAAAETSSDDVEKENVVNSAMEAGVDDVEKEIVAAPVSDENVASI